MHRDIDEARRELLRAALAGTAVTAGGALLPGTAWPQSTAPRPPFVPDLHLQLRAMPDRIALLPGPPTPVWRYDGTVLKGDPQAFELLSGSYLPVLRLRRGQKVRIELINQLHEPTVVHWHGLTVPAAMDGHPRTAITPGEHYVYEFEVRNRAGTYWFHAHPDGRTGAQIYYGLAGVLIVSDDEEASLGLPGGPYDVPLVLQDRSFDGDNQFVYLAGHASGERRGMMGGMMGGSGMMGGPGMMRGDGMMATMRRMMGFLGDRIVVNGKPDVVLPVAARAYRLRLLNASNARIFKLAWSDGSPLTVIGTDGGLLAQPLTHRYVTLAPAERVDVWVDFARYPLGTELTLRSLAFHGDMAMGGMMNGMGTMMSGTALPNGADFPVLTVRVAQRAPHNDPLPARLTVLPAVAPQRALNAAHPRIFNVTMGMMRWGINGRSFEMEGVTQDETVHYGTTEVWEFRNEQMMSMAHAMHVHGLQFRVIGRAVQPHFASARQSVFAGYMDEGWKDTVLVMPGERVRLLLRFDGYPGLFLYHCHMLEHEDAGLMRNYLIKAS
jgi:FtsP/CotA-like multicopper oxidase with cupredoxin domain